MFKFFAYILSVYVLVLTAIPCIDEPKDYALHKIELSNTTSDNDENHKDHCSPFCTCDCCVSPIINNSTFQVAITRFSQELISEYTISFISSLFTTIWQPPKLS